MASRDDKQALAFVLDQLRDPERFVQEGPGALRGARGAELRLARLQGRPDVRAVLRARRRSAGKTVGRVWSFHDVTRMRLMEDTIRRHARAFDHISDAVLTLDLEARIVDWNPGAERMFGYSKAEMLGRTPRPRCGRPGDTGRRGSARPRCAGTGAGAGETRFVRKDGTHRRLRHGRRAAVRRLRADPRGAGGVPRRDRPQEPRGIPAAGDEPVGGIPEQVRPHTRRRRCHPERSEGSLI